MKVDIDTISKLRLPPNWRNLLLELPSQPGFSKIPMILTGLMILLLTSSLAEFTWMLFDEAAVSSSKPVSQSVRQQSRGPQTTRLRDVASWSLFGKAENKATASQQALINAPKSNLSLTLKGLLAADVQSEAIAIIADARGKEKSYKVGADLPGNAKLHTIYDDRVILSRAGRLETLSLPVKTLSKGALVRNTVAPVKSRQVRAGGSLKSMRDSLIKNPQEIWKNIRIEPKMNKSGAIQGYTLSHKDKKLMRRLGIKKTDIITSVNGMPLNDPTSLYQILDVLKTTQQLNLSIIRNGTEQTLNIDMM
ncbi:MAG: type II secretion system protein GspC [Gammaproteobacteria bacterium]